MRLFRVDPEKCKRDGICAAECPLKIIIFKDDGSPPEPTEEAEGLCIDCGHCVAVCPHGAFTHRSMGPEACLPLSTDWRLSAEVVAGLFKGRRSVRTFRERPVERSAVATLIDIAAHAPSGHNVQPVRWLILSSREGIHTLAGLTVEWMRSLIAGGSPLAGMFHMERTVAHWERGEDLICRDAPCLVVAHAPKDERSAPAACTIALTYLELAVPSLGLGACWAGYFNTAANLWPPLMTALGLPEGHATFGAMMLGVPKYSYHRIPLRKTPVITWR